MAEHAVWWEEVLGAGRNEYVFVGEELVDNYSNGIFFLLFYRFLVVPEGKLVSNWSCQTLDSPCLCSLLQDFV